MKWFQQLVHHDIWDYDLAAAPILIDVRRSGRTIPAVAQQTKMALMFIFNRETGEPIFGIEERPVPQTTAPGEWTSPTQPFPVKPPPLARNSLKQSELSKVTPEHQAFCEALWDKYKLSDACRTTRGSVGQDILVFPGAQGGGNWHGVDFNKPLGLIITNVHDRRPVGSSAGRRTPRRRRRGRRRSSAGAAPRQQPECAAAHVEGHARGPDASGIRRSAGAAREPPWGELVAVNANTGDIAWRVPLGEFEELAAKGIHDRHAELRRRHHHRRQPRVHRRDDRRLLPRVRRAQRQGALVATSCRRPRRARRRPTWAATASSTSSSAPTAAASSAARRPTKSSPTG